MDIGDKKVEESDQSTQSDETSEEYGSSYNEKLELHTPLFNAEDNYNNVLSELKHMNLDSATQTQSVPCENCPCVEKEINLAAAETNELALQVKEKEQEVMEARLNDKEIVENNLLLPHLELRYEPTERSDENENLRLYLNEQFNYHDEMRRTTYEEISDIKNYYLTYLITYQEKCNLMICELEEMKEISSVDSVPSLAEVEQQIIIWQICLKFAVHKHSIMVNFYHDVTHKLFSHTERTMVIPSLTLIPEPPSGVFSNPFGVYRRESSRMPYTRMIHKTDLPEIKNENFNSEKNTEEAKTTQSNSELLKETTGAKMNRKSKKRKAEDEERVLENPTPCSSNSEITPENLLLKMKERCPHVPDQILQQALDIVREARGDITDLNSVTFLSDLKNIITYLLEKQKNTHNETEKANLCGPIDNDIHRLHQRHYMGLCNICQSEMMSQNTSKLPCRHLFHTACIRLWFMNNAICPTCLYMK